MLLRVLIASAALCACACTIPIGARDDRIERLGSPSDGPKFGCGYNYLGDLTQHWIVVFAPSAADAEIKVRLNKGKFCCPVENVSCRQAPDYYQEDGFVAPDGPMASLSGM